MHIRHVWFSLFARQWLDWVWYNDTDVPFYNNMDAFTAICLLSIADFMCTNYCLVAKDEISYLYASLYTYAYIRLLDCTAYSLPNITVCVVWAHNIVRKLWAWCKYLCSLKCLFVRSLPVEEIHNINHFSPYA